MPIEMAALKRAIDYLVSKGFTEKEAEIKIATYVILSIGRR